MLGPAFSAEIPVKQHLEDVLVRYWLHAHPERLFQNTRLELKLGYQF